MLSRIKEFITYVSSLEGDEKGEAQVFCDRFFQSLGKKGYKEAGAILEFRVKTKRSTRFADLLWGERVLIEMKKKGSKLQSHRSQVCDYWWKLRPNQPKYVRTKKDTDRDRAGSPGHPWEVPVPRLPIRGSTNGIRTPSGYVRASIDRSLLPGLPLRLGPFSQLGRADRFF